MVADITMKATMYSNTAKQNFNARPWRSPPMALSGRPALLPEERAVMVTRLLQGLWQLPWDNGRRCCPFLYWA